MGAGPAVLHLHWRRRSHRLAPAQSEQAEPGALSPRLPLSLSHRRRTHARTHAHSISPPTSEFWESSQLRRWRANFHPCGGGAAISPIRLTSSNFLVWNSDEKILSEHARAQNSVWLLTASFPSHQAFFWYFFYPQAFGQTN